MQKGPIYIYINNWIQNYKYQSNNKQNIDRGFDTNIFVTRKKLIGKVLVCLSGPNFNMHFRYFGIPTSTKIYQNQNWVQLD